MFPQSDYVSTSRISVLQSHQFLPAAFCRTKFNFRVSITNLVGKIPNSRNVPATGVEFATSIMFLKYLNCAFCSDSTSDVVRTDHVYN